MTDNNSIRSGSLQFYPRVRAKRVIPNVNWKTLPQFSETKFLGFIGYKVGMASAWVRDETQDSMTKGKRIVIPVTILECPPMKIFSVRFYKDNKLLKEFVVSNEKILKRRIKLPKNVKKIEDVSDYSDVRVILYSEVRKTGIGKKSPNFLEVALSGSKESKLNFIKEKIGKEIFLSDFISSSLFDVRAVTRGLGTQGPVKRFGISLKDHKSEKGRRRPGSLAPWHPARITFRTPMAGQTGYHTRISYNHKLIQMGKITEKDINLSGGFAHYGLIKNEYIILQGSIPGPKKRGVVITPSYRPTKSQLKKKYEFIELR